MVDRLGDGEPDGERTAWRFAPELRDRVPGYGVTVTVPLVMSAMALSPAVLASADRL